MPLTPTVSRRSERVLTRPCRHCGTPFEPIRDHQRFCKASCRVEHFRARSVPQLPFDQVDDVITRPPFE